MSRFIFPLVFFFATLLASLPAFSAVTIDWLLVGNAGNAADPSTQFGAVAYNYNIGKYDVTVAQYTEFLNAVAKSDPYELYDSHLLTNQKNGVSRNGSSGSYSYSVVDGWANMPVKFVGWGDAARFCNWLQNGQPIGAEGPGVTETGAYTLNGAMTDAALNAVTRNPDATVFIPTGDEWYKAAYYNASASSYYRYPFSSDTLPTPAAPGNTPNTGNFLNSDNGFAAGPPYYITNVGAYTASASPYGAFDMGGNLWQWTEEKFGTFRNARGGSYDLPAGYLSRFSEYGVHPSQANGIIGFRLASVPEPSTAVLAALSFGILLFLRRRLTNR